MFHIVGELSTQIVMTAAFPLFPLPPLLPMSNAVQVAFSKRKKKKLLSTTVVSECVCMYVHMYVCVCVYVFMYVLICGGLMYQN